MNAIRIHDCKPTRTNSKFQNLTETVSLKPPIVCNGRSLIAISQKSVCESIASKESKNPPNGKTQPNPKHHFTITKNSSLDYSKSRYDSNYNKPKSREHQMEGKIRLNCSELAKLNNSAKIRQPLDIIRKKLTQMAKTTPLVQNSFLDRHTSIEEHTKFSNYRPNLQELTSNSLVFNNDSKTRNKIVRGSTSSPKANFNILKQHSLLQSVDIKRNSLYKSLQDHQCYTKHHYKDDDLAEAREYVFNDSKYAAGNIGITKFGFKDQYSIYCKIRNLNDTLNEFKNIMPGLDNIDKGAGQEGDSLIQKRDNSLETNDKFFMKIKNTNKNLYKDDRLRYNTYTAIKNANEHSNTFISDAKQGIAESTSYKLSALRKLQHINGKLDGKQSLVINQIRINTDDNNRRKGKIRFYSSLQTRKTGSGERPVLSLLNRFDRLKRRTEVAVKQRSDDVIISKVHMFVKRIPTFALALQD